MLEESKSALELEVKNLNYLKRSLDERLRIDSLNHVTETIASDSAMDNRIEMIISELNKKVCEQFRLFEIF